MTPVCERRELAMPAEETRPLVFTMRPNRALHRRLKREELPTGRAGASEQTERNIDTARVRVHLDSNSDPDGSGTLNTKRHAAQKKGLQIGQDTTTGEALFHTAVDLIDTTKTDPINR